MSFSPTPRVSMNISSYTVYFTQTLNVQMLREQYPGSGWRWSGSKTRKCLQQSYAGRFVWVYIIYIYIYIYSREWHGAHDPPIQRIDKVCAVKSHHPRKSSEITFFPLFLPRPPPSQRVYAPTIHIILYRVFRLGVRVDPSYTLRRVRLENINNNNI